MLLLIGSGGGDVTFGLGTDEDVIGWSTELGERVRLRGGGRGGGSILVRTGGGRLASLSLDVWLESL